MFLKSLFELRKNEIKDINDYFYNEFKKYNLREIFLLCDLTSERIEKHNIDSKKIDTIWTYLTKSKKIDKINKFGIYNQHEISKNFSRAKAIREIIDKFGEDIFYKNITARKLTQISNTLKDYPSSTIFPLKVYCISRGEDFRFKYDGIQPNTPPCQKITKILYGDTFKSASLLHTDVCREISKDLTISTTDANSLLYVLGSKL